MYTIAIDDTVCGKWIYSWEWDTGILRLRRFDFKYINYAYKLFNKLFRWGQSEIDAVLWRTVIGKSPLVAKRILENGQHVGMAVYIGKYNEILVDVIFVALRMALYDDIAEIGWGADGYEIIGMMRG